MAGYSPDFSMSNNAKTAYAEGRVPASKIPGVPAVLVRLLTMLGSVPAELRPVAEHLHIF